MKDIKKSIIIQNSTVEGSFNEGSEKSAGKTNHEEFAISSELKKQVLSLLAKSQITEAIQLLETHSATLGKDITEALINLSARQFRLDRQIALNTISHDNAEIERNKIIKAMAEMVDG